MSKIGTIADPTGDYTITQELVHKLDPEEVFLTNWRRTGPDSFTVAARWPADQPFYRAADGEYEPLLVTETVRQLFPLLCHVGYGTPFGHHLVWEGYRYELAPHALSGRDGPAMLELRVVCSDIVHRRSQLAALTMDVDVLRDGMPVATAHSRFTVQAPAVYSRLRGANADSAGAMAAAPPAAAPISARYSGRPDPADVVLAQSPAPGISISEFPEEFHGTRPDGWWLRVDTAHRKYFDHPVDHAPGMLLLEAARQAAQAVLHPRPVLPVTMEAAFHRYVELDAPCRIEARVLPDGPVRVTAEQHGQLCFTAEVGTGDRPVLAATAGTAGAADEPG
ncbi:ScbA/BarX family gamma-butyrolactone biosynthesis protein [Kitasatospora sp. NPDC058170]|uniref:ScbA/BarX family gamma-butyrolactone biosynthesis protein n=1 Tax=Kitasatospora sp. NPDC058170 TaxID=3346364 RepID=UPI0036DF84DB